MRRMAATACAPHSSSTNGRHVAAGAVLGLQRAVVCLDHHRAHRVHEAAVALDLGRVAEVLREDEVQVALERVAEDDRLVVAMLVAAGVCRSSVASASRSTGNATSSMITVVPVGRIAPTAGTCPCARSRAPPHSAGSVVKRSGVAEREVVELRRDRVDLDRRARPPSRRASRPAGRAVRRAARAAPRACRACPPPSAATRGRAARPRRPASACKRVTALHAVSRWSNRISALALWACSSTVVVGDLADEAERAFRADHQVREDVDRIAEVDQRVQAVAGRVLEPELVADARGQRRVCARRPRRARPRLATSSGRSVANAARLAGVARVEHRAVGEHDAQAGERVVAVLRRAAAHAAGVVGGDAADHRGVDRRRVRADLAAQRREACDWRRRR